MRIDFLSTEGHYNDHMQPIWDALPEEAKGNWFQHVRPDKPTGNITLVCSYGNLLRMRNRGPVVFMEHGIGYSYVNDLGERFYTSYAGSSKRDGVILFLNNHELTQDLNRKSHPAIPGVIVGTPKMDAWAGRTWETPENPLAVYSTHWDCRVVPETRSAHKEYRWALRPEVSEGFTWNGHAHPRGWSIVKTDYKQFYIPTIKNFSDVLDQGSIYVADTTSTLYEFAYTGKPIVAMNASFYRRNVNHGLRFWDYVPGLQVDKWQDVAGAIARSLDGEGEEARARAVDVVYPIKDGTSSKRAAAALCELL